jgi:hypothetical protein
MPDWPDHVHGRRFSSKFEIASAGVQHCDVRLTGVALTGSCQRAPSQGASIYSEVVPYGNTPCCLSPARVRSKQVPCHPLGRST